MAIELTIKTSAIYRNEPISPEARLLKHTAILVISSPDIFARKRKAIAFERNVKLRERNIRDGNEIILRGKEKIMHGNGISFRGNEMIILRD